MTFVLFAPAGLPGQVPTEMPPGHARPAIDASEVTGLQELSVPEPDDGPPSAPIVLQTLSAGVLQSSLDPGRITFDGVGFDCSSILMDGRFVLTAASPSLGRWTGQIRYRWVSDVLTRPRKGRRDAGGVRILFLDPLTPAGFSGRHFLDLSTARPVRPEALAWDLVQRIAVDRRRWIPSTAPGDQRNAEELLARGRLPAKAPAWYAIPMPSVVSSFNPVPSVSVASEIPTAPDIPGATFPIEEAWSSPPANLTETSISPAPLAPPPTESAAKEPFADSDRSMIVSVPGVGRHARVAAPGPAMVRMPADGPRQGARTYRVEMDGGQLVSLDSSMLFGRDPAGLEGEDVRLQVVPDQSLSFSKTHLLLTVSPGGIWVTDRHSTNGVLVCAPDGSNPCVPGVPRPLDLPATLQIGTRTMQITLTDR